MLLSGPEHCCWRIYMMIYSVICFVCVLVFNAIGGPGLPPFQHSTGNVSDLYATEITPAGWTFSIWGVIYTGLALMWVFLVAGLCRRNEFGFVYCKPGVLPNWWFGIWAMNCGMNIGWLFVWDRSYDNKWLLIIAMVLLFLIAFSNYVLIGVSAKSLALYGPWLHQKHRLDLWLQRVVVENSLGLYATWTTIASLINLTTVLTYLAGMSMEDSATVALAILLVEALVWYAGELRVGALRALPADALARGDRGTRRQPGQELGRHRRSVSQQHLHGRDPGPCVRAVPDPHRSDRIPPREKAALHGRRGGG